MGRPYPGPVNLSKEARERVAIGSAVHQAMTETIDVPPDDVFQVITEHDEAGLRDGGGHGLPPVP